MTGGADDDDDDDDEGTVVPAAKGSSLAKPSGAPAAFNPGNVAPERASEATDALASAPVGGAKA